jgi:hypothetical protein
MLVERWNGRRWSAQPLAVPPGVSQVTARGGYPPNTVLAGVSCRSASACTIVGSMSYPEGYEVTLAERWNGHRWSVQSTPSQLGINLAHLAGVSCSSPTACTAVGYYATVTGAAPVAERWNGVSWSIQQSSRL